MEKIKNFVKKEVVLCVAVVLAVASACFILPDREYIGYIDFRTLGILFCLMCVMAGLQQIGVFKRIAQWLLGKVHKPSQIVMLLVFLCFFFSMAITNDVALITFVPFTFTVGKMLGEKVYKRMVFPTVVLQTIGANLGSMLTPIGNPQNLYLYGFSKMQIGEFLVTMLPYSAASLVLLLICCVCFGYRLGAEGEAGDLTQGDHEALKKTPLVIYLALFVVCLLTVAQVIPFQVALGIVIVGMLIVNWKVMLSVDYCLLLTFIAFFVFIGNMGRIPAFSEFLQRMVAGNEVVISVLVSQCISNVPAALLLSGFTTNAKGLLIGTNLGGLGTLIASMASLISYKYVAIEAQESEIPGGKGRYFLYFTVANIAFLAVLMVLFWIL